MLSITHARTHTQVHMFISVEVSRDRKSHTVEHIFPAILGTVLQH